MDALKLVSHGAIPQMYVMQLSVMKNVSLVRVVSLVSDIFQMSGVYMESFNGAYITGPGLRCLRLFACRAPGRHGLYFPSVSQKDAFVPRASSFELSMRGQTVRLRIDL